MATNFAKDIDREIAALEAQRVAAQEQVETVDKKIKYLRGLQELYAPPSAARREKDKFPPPPGATRVVIPPELGGVTDPTGAAPTPEQPSEEPSGAIKTALGENAGPVSGYGPTVMGEPPSIATTVMSVERPPGPEATPIPWEGPIRTTTEQMRGGR